MTTHYSSDLCRKGKERKIQREAAVESVVRALDVTFAAYGLWGRVGTSRDVQVLG